jgi:hypothetical protein
MLVSILFFALTGFTLNHRDWFSNEEISTIKTFELPRQINVSEWPVTQPMLLAQNIYDWLRKNHELTGPSYRADWNADEALLYLDVKRPGGYSTVEVDLRLSSVRLENSDYGALATLNDLHMGRGSSWIWSVFIDVSAWAMLLFSVTGMWLILPQKKRKQKLMGVGVMGALLMFGFYLMAA